MGNLKYPSSNYCSLTLVRLTLESSMFALTNTLTLALNKITVTLILIRCVAHFTNVYRSLFHNNLHERLVHVTGPTKETC